MMASTKQVYLCRLCNFQLINKQEAREKALYFLLLPASCGKANSQTVWKRSRRGVEFCVPEFGTRQLAGLYAKKVLAAIMAVPNVGSEQESVSIYFQLFSYSFF